MWPLTMDKLEKINSLTSGKAIASFLAENVVKFMMTLVNFMSSSVLV